MFLLPARVILRPRVMDSIGEEQRNSRDFLSLFFFSLFFFLPPSAVTARIGRRQSKLTITGRFRVVTGRKQPQSMVPPGSGQSAY
ncbi:hypothetical protein BHE74_00041716 [Ensete ventricosum]|nr:hypothetical protein GW17_00036752 [Ensete ventricosum]RWW51902.1 hypothetical protein BHE74_00041716 [Ensete ventricosum]RZS17129.1 hypothetical protein BHM03_00049244 [Ensete ventricosum]